MTRLLLAAIILALALLSCRQHSDGNATPRRYGFPRIETYDTIYRHITVGPAEICVNAGAETSSPRPGWLDIDYPRYGAKIYVSVSRPDDMDKAIANRRQRISLNLGGTKAKTIEFEQGGYDCLTVESVDAGATPVQFLAVSADGIMVNATANIPGRTVPADSIRPIVEALTADILRIIPTER